MLPCVVWDAVSPIGNPVFATVDTASRERGLKGLSARRLASARRERSEGGAGGEPLEPARDVGVSDRQRRRSVEGSPPHAETSQPDWPTHPRGSDQRGAA